MSSQGHRSAEGLRRFVLQFLLDSRDEDCQERIADVFRELGDDLRQAHSLSEVKDLEKWMRNCPKLFDVGRTGGITAPVTVAPKTTLTCCRAHSACAGSCGNGACAQLHLCRFFLLSERCPFKGRCHFGHTLGTRHNRRALKKHGLKSLNIPQLRRLLCLPRVRRGTTCPPVCRFYNIATKCDKEDRCHFIHLCKYFVTGECKFKTGCRRSHNIHDFQVRQVLELYGVETEGRPQREVLSQISAEDATQRPARDGSENGSAESSQGSDLLSETEGELSSVSDSSEEGEIREDCGLRVSSAERDGWKGQLQQSRDCVQEPRAGAGAGAGGPSRWQSHAALQTRSYDSRRSGNWTTTSAGLGLGLQPDYTARKKMPGLPMLEATGGGRGRRRRRRRDDFFSPPMSPSLRGNLSTGQYEGSISSSSSSSRGRNLLTGQYEDISRVLSLLTEQYGNGNGGERNLLTRQYEGNGRGRNLLTRQYEGNGRGRNLLTRQYEGNGRERRLLTRQHEGNGRGYSPLKRSQTQRRPDTLRASSRQDSPQNLYQGRSLSPPPPSPPSPPPPEYSPRASFSRWADEDRGRSSSPRTPPWTSYEAASLAPEAGRNRGAIWPATAGDTPRSDRRQLGKERRRHGRKRRHNSVQEPWRWENDDGSDRTMSRPETFQRRPGTSKFPREDRTSPSPFSGSAFSENGARPGSPLFPRSSTENENRRRGTARKRRFPENSRRSRGLPQSPRNRNRGRVSTVTSAAPLGVRREESKIDWRLDY